MHLNRNFWDYSWRLTPIDISKTKRIHTLHIVIDKTKSYGENGQIKKMRSISTFCNWIKSILKPNIWGESWRFSRACLRQSKRRARANARATIRKWWRSSMITSIKLYLAWKNWLKLMASPSAQLKGKKRLRFKASIIKDSKTYRIQDSF